MQPISSSASYIILWSTLTLLLQSAYAEPQVPCYFVFGDSLSDNGNNNNLPTKANANYPPYGIDYPGHVPTGRFSNGKNIIDVISGHLGFDESVPPFASIDALDRNVILKGVNYASGSAGIRSETGQHLGVRIPLDQQLMNHQRVISSIQEIESSSYLNECLYMINIGSNDYLNNYFLPESYSTSDEYTPKQYAQALIDQYSQQIQTLYEMGARKVALFGVGELGLVPQAISKCDGLLGFVCVAEKTYASTLFNDHLRKLVDELNKKFTDAIFTCINMDVIYPSSSMGFEQLTEACCQVRSDGQCKEGNTSCRNRDRYVFFDNFHPTEAMNKRIGARAYNKAASVDVHPIDIRTLAMATKKS